MRRTKLSIGSSALNAAVRKPYAGTARVPPPSSKSNTSASISFSRKKASLPTNNSGKPLKYYKTLSQRNAIMRKGRDEPAPDPASMTLINPGTGKIQVHLPAPTAIMTAIPPIQPTDASEPEVRIDPRTGKPPRTPIDVPMAPTGPSRKVKQSFAFQSKSSWQAKRAVKENNNGFFINCSLAIGSSGVNCGRTRLAGLSKNDRNFVLSKLDASRNPVFQFKKMCNFSDYKTSFPSVSETHPSVLLLANDDIGPGQLLCLWILQAISGY